MYDAIVLAGGAARRLGGVAKPQLRVRGRTLLDRVLAAVPDAGRIVVVGPEQPVAAPVAAPVVWCREDPPGSGPVAAVAAALPRVSASMVVLLAADLPDVAPAVSLLLAACPSDGAALLADAGGRANHLAAAWSRPAMTAAVGRLETPVGAAMRALVARVDLVLVPDTGGWGRDCDTWDDVVSAREGMADG